MLKTSESVYITESVVFLNIKDTRCPFLEFVLFCIF